MAQQWYKFYGGEYLADTKIATLSAQERSCWITLLCLASTSTIPGVVEFLTVEVLLNKSGIIFDPLHPEDWDKAISVLQKFERMKMIEIGDNGLITILNWERRQESPLSVTERVRKYRAKIREKYEDVTIGNDGNENDNDRVEENRIDKNRIESIYTHYGEFQNVKLTDEQHAKLIESMGSKNLDLLIFELDTYIENNSKGKKYRNHYAVIQTWARRKVADYQKNKSFERRIV